MTKPRVTLTNKQKLPRATKPYWLPPQIDFKTPTTFLWCLFHRTARLRTNKLSDGSACCDNIKIFGLVFMCLRRHAVNLAP